MIYVHTAAIHITAVKKLRQLSKYEGGDMARIKALLMDVDGTLTDGKIYMGENGE